MSAQRSSNPLSRRNANRGARPSRGLQLESSAAPIARNFRVRNAQPQMRELSSGSTLITGHEEIATVAGSVSFAATRYRFNPGLPLFTRLSQLAATYEKYRVRRLEFVYVPANAVTTTPGVVYLAADYDPVDAAPASLAALSTYETQDSSRVYDALKLRLSRNRMHDGVQAKKIRCGAVAGDLQLYDVGSVSVATVSCTDSSDIGQLWVYYEIELISPQTNPAAPVPQGFSLWNRSSAQSFTSTVAATLAFDEQVVDGLELTNASGVFTMPCGLFEVTANCSLNDSAAESFVAQLAIFKNGAALSPPVASSAYNSAATEKTHAITCVGYVECSDGDTISVSVTLTGAAGTLTARQDECRIAFRAL